MGKKHAPPQPIDIFNAPSPRTLLTTSSRSSGAVVRGGSVSAGVKEAPSPNNGNGKRARDNGPRGSGGSRSASAGTGNIDTPTGSGPTFPESPPPETIEDYGDVQETSTSANSEDFSTDGDDGNDVTADEEGSDFDDDDDDDGEFDSDEEQLDDGEVEEENADDEDDYEDDEEEATHVNLDFDALPMDEDDIDSVMHLMDQLIPDHMNEVDRDDLGKLLAEEPITTLIQLADEGEGDSPDVLGMVSLLNFGHLTLNKKHSALVALQTILEKNVWSVVHSGIAPHFLLTSKDDQQRCKSMWLISEHIRNTPLPMVSRVLDFALETFDADQKTGADLAKKSQGAGKGNAQPAKQALVTNPCMFVILAKIQRDPEKSAAASKRDRKGAAGAPPAKQKRRVDTSASPASGINVEEDYLFWREEDRILYSNRDERVAVHAYRCRPQYDLQPESERPITLSFAVTADALRKSLGQIRKLASE